MLARWKIRQLSHSTEPKDLLSMRSKSCIQKSGIDLIVDKLKEQFSDVLQ